MSNQKSYPNDGGSFIVNHDAPSTVTKTKPKVDAVKANLPETPIDPSTEHPAAPEATE